MANLGLLSFLSGAGAGAVARRKELEDRRRTKFLEKLEQSKFDVATRQGDTRLGFDERGVAIQERGATLAEQEAGRRRDEFNRQFSAEYDDILPGDLNFGGRRLPGSRADLKIAMPYLTQELQDKGADRRQSGELNFRLNNPHLYGSNKFESRLTPEQAAIYGLIKGVYGSPPFLGETPGGREGLAREGVTTLRDIMPSLFGGMPNPASGPSGLDTFNTFTKENPTSFSSKNQARRGLQLFQTQHPMSWAQMSEQEKQVVLNYINTLPEISDQDMIQYKDWVKRGSPFTSTGQ